MKTIAEQLRGMESFRDSATHGRRAGPGHLNLGPWRVEALRYGLRAGEYSPPLVRATVLTSDFPSERSSQVSAVPTRQVFLRDLMPVVGLETPKLDYARITGWSASAGGVAENTAKSELAITSEAVLASVETIAAWAPLTRQVLYDVTGLAQWLDVVMTFFLGMAEDYAILNNNNASTFKGILQTSGIQTQAVGTDTKTDAIRKAITKIRRALAPTLGPYTAGFEPTAIVLNPSDAEKIELLKDTSGAYLLPPAMAAPIDLPLETHLWRVPVIESNAIQVGTGLVGAFDVATILWTYEAIEIMLSDAHADYFTKNLVAARAEVRELLAVYFPGAFCTVTGL